MSSLLLTAYQGSILGPIARVLGWIMNWIYVGVYKLFGIESVALSIFLITVLIYMALLPLTIKQQKFAKLQQKMQPEIKEIQEKYKGKKDQESMAAMQSETQMIYAKYGVSPMGSCVQMLIQMPILLALYRVFMNIPAYITSIKTQFGVDAAGDVVKGSLVDVITSTPDFQTKMTEIVDLYSKSLKQVGAKFDVTDVDALNNYVVDVLYKLPNEGWDTLASKFDNIGPAVDAFLPHLNKFNYLFGINISESPITIITRSFGAGAWGMLFLALMVPVLSYLTQVLSLKLMPQSNNAVDQNDQMAQQMKMMNTMMPLMSLVFCFSVPVGLGIYWIFSALVRTVQMFFINRHIANLNLEDIIAKNQEKAKKKNEKMGIYQDQIRNAAKTNTRTISSKANTVNKTSIELDVNISSEPKTYKEGSLAAKANKVREFNERNSR